MSRKTWPMGWWLAGAVVLVALGAFVTMFFASVVVERTPRGPDRQTLTNRLSAERDRWSDPGWQAEVADQARTVGVEVRLTDAQQRVLFQTEPQPAPTGALLTTAYNRRWVEVREVLDGSEPEGYAYISYPWNPWLTDDRNIAWDGVWLSLALVVGSVLVGSLGAIWLLSRFFLAPLRSLAAAAERVRQGEWTPPLRPSYVTEVAEVLEAFQRMAGSLKESVGRQAAMEEERRFFLAAISHDLRTPLFSLRGRLEGLRDGIARTPEQVAQYIHFGLTRVAEMERLVSDLFAYSRLNILEQEPDLVGLEVGSLLREAAAKHGVAAESKGVDLRLVSSAGPCTIQADPHLLLRAVDNLLENGIRHTPAGGSVELGVRSESGRVVIWVADTGKGIPPEIVARLFTPFFRGDSSRSRQTGGAGLGLVIARRVAEAHGGSLTAENRPEGGARFTLTFPEQAKLAPTSKTVPSGVWA